MIREGSMKEMALDLSLSGGFRKVGGKTLARKF